MSLHPPTPGGPKDGAPDSRTYWRLLAVGLAMLVVAVIGAGALVVNSSHGQPAPHAVSPTPAAGAGDDANVNNPANAKVGGATPTQQSPAALPPARASGGGPLAGVGALGPGAPTADWVVTENAQPGTRDWLLTKPAKNHEIEGYANAVSINAGGSATLFVSTGAPTFHVDAYRMGYYSGAQGRHIWSSPELPGVTQTACALTPGVNTVSCAWQPSLTVPTGAGWPEGDYLFKLVASTGWQSYVPLTIRNDGSTAAYEIDNDVTTWQAYNLYGGYDLYQGPGGYASRSRIVSFDRPYTLGTGSGDFLGNELHVVSLMESLGLDVTYSTDVDLDQHPELLLAHKAFLSLGHDEYYSLAMRTGLQGAVNQGINLVFFGANAIYRHIRFQPSPNGPDRLEVDYKAAAEDPLNGKDNADVTPVAWRDPPNSLPESAIIGDYYQCNPVTADMVITDPSSWLFAGTGVAQGTQLTDLVGTEYDHFDPKAPGPRNVTVLARSPLVCQKRADYADMTYYTAPSGAGVFASGTLNWVPKMVPTPCAFPCPGPTVVRVTENILAAFGSGPAGRAHPSTANWQGLAIPQPSPASAAPPASPGPDVGEGKSQ
ncbi:MAG TPA: N,N-dimethylformamidase beta subunit family domain-containing protein [Actinomycetota bacterium]|nr:N,N-dimethylformamidase beta subunit family domain-containing protein [Actinomycetota bacterium]